jgi:hypothetical protein
MTSFDRSDNKNYTDVDLTEMAFTPMREMMNRKGSFQCYINESASSRTCPRFQIPLDSSPFGIEIPDGSSLGEEIAKNAKLKMKMDASDPAFAKFMRNLDSYIVDKAKMNKNEWFPGKNFSDAKIETLYKPKITQDPAMKYPPRFTLKIVTRPGANQTRLVRKVHTDTGDAFTTMVPQEIKPRAKMLAIIELKGVWVSPVGFGLDIDATDIFVDSGKRKAKEFDFIMDKKMHEATAEELSAELDYDTGRTEPEDETYRELEIETGDNLDDHE